MTLRCCYLPSNFNFPHINSQQELAAFTFCCLILLVILGRVYFRLANFVRRDLRNDENHSGLEFTRLVHFYHAVRAIPVILLSVSFALKMWIYFPRWSYNLVQEKRPYPSLMTGNPRVSGFLRFDAILQGCQM